MSKASTTGKQQPSPALTPNASAWSRGPPTAASNTSSNVPSAVSTPPPNGGSANEPATGATPVAIGGAASKRGSLMVGGNGDVLPRGNLAFGTVDSPNPLLSSSPAAPAATGSHLADAVKSFGSIDAETTAAGASMIRPPRRTSGGANPTGPSGLPQKKLDVHSLFAGKPQSANSSSGTPMSPSQQPAQVASPIMDRRQSIGQNYPGANGLPNSAPHPYGQSAPGQPPHLRPPQGQGQPRSPVMGVAQPGQFAGGQVPPGGQPFRGPPQSQMQGSPAPVRPTGAMGVQRPMMGQQGMPFMPPGQPGYGMMYPYYNPYDQGHYMPGGQWAPPPSNMPLSPRSAQAQLGQPSPAPPAAPLPGSASNSPMPTPPSRPQSLVGGAQPSSPMPSTPQRPMQPASPFTPQMTPTSAPSTPGLSAGAMAFTPRAKNTIKISRPDGTSVNLAEAAAAAKVPTPSSSGVATPDLAAADEAPKRKIPTLPVIVRLESEEQKKARLAEEEKLRKMKEEEAREEQERKDRLERRAKEEEQRKKEEEERKLKEAKEAEEKAAKEKEEAEKAKKADEEAAAAKAKAEAEAAAAAAAAAKAEESKPATPAEDKAATPASDKPEEARRALLTPASSSAAPSPVQSPALAAAGLPAKPVGAINGARRPTPAALDVKSATASSAPSASTPSALSSAKPIEDLASVEYPSTVKPQRADLNTNASPGKFRYERDFLMQFMEVCKEKPETLPPLEEIGLEADNSSSFGTRRGPNRSTPGVARTSSNMGSNRGFGSGSSMGSFAHFSNSSSIRNTTSEDRYMKSLQSRIGTGMSRTPSQGGSMYVPIGTDRSSRRGETRSQRGGKRVPQERASAANDPDVAPLAITANAWVNARSAPTDEKSPAYIERKVKALLNKLTEEKFDSIAAQILEWANKSKEEEDGMTLKLVIKLVFEKSTDESHWSAMYAKLCRLLLERLDPQVSEVIDGKVTAGGSLFRKYLLGRCQADFEAGWKAREEAALLAVAKSAEDKERLAKAEAEKDSGGDAPMMSDEYYAAQKAKRRGLGLVQLIGELYKLEMLSKAVIRECLVRLLGNVENPDEEDLESTCKLLTTVGKQFEEASGRQLDVVFERLNALTKNENVSSRIRFMIMDIIDLRKNKWVSKKEVVPTTIAQIHQQAARENAEKAQAARESISRGGSRAGHSRREGGGSAQPGEWQSVGTTGPRPPQRPTDLSNFGRGVSSAGLPNTPTFGPTGAFARGRKGGAAGSTPPLSRHSSTTNMSNMFGVLNEAADSSNETTEAAPERKKLQLAPRTKPIPTADGEGEHDGSDAEEATEEATSMTEEEAKNKIAMDVKELWGEKDAGGSRNPDDIVEYYNALPAEHRHLLSERLGEDVFRIAKLRDAEIVAKGWKAVLKAEAATVEDLKKGLLARMPTLDDDAIDFPQAYKAVALLMRSLALEQADIDALMEKVDVYGEPRITPKMKLEKALGQVDEEAAASA